MTIKQKQWQLWYLDFYHGEIDGIWGNLSKEATKNFQSKNGLKPDGDFGPLTEAKSMEIIRDIQDVIGVTADGLAGEQTKAATAEWQVAHDLIGDGIAGPLTRAAVEEVSKNFWDGVKHFTKEEFACKCGGRYCNGYPVEIKQLLVTTADRMRAHFGVPVHVSSGLRCPKHNTNVGGVAGSRHKVGKAVDFRVEGKSAAQVLEFVRQQPEIRYCYAIDSNYVHMDIL